MNFAQIKGGKQLQNNVEKKADIADVYNVDESGKKTAIYRKNSDKIELEDLDKDLQEVVNAAAVATKPFTPRKINLVGNASGSATYDGLNDVNIDTTVNESKHAATADTATTADSATKANNSDKLNGYSLNTTENAMYGSVPFVKDDGVMEVGQTINWHATNDSSQDYSSAWTAKEDGTVDVGTINGTFNGNAASADIASTVASNAATEDSPVARSIWISDVASNSKQVVSPNLTYTCSTKTLSAENINGHLIGNADTATTANKGNWQGKNDDRWYQMAFSLDSNFNYQSKDAFKYNPATNVLKVGTVQGDVNGNATTATTATKAINDGNGANIANTYLKRSGGTMTGALALANYTWNSVGDDGFIGDHNIIGTVCFIGKNGETGIALCNKANEADFARISYGGSNINFNKTIGGNITGNAGSANVGKALQIYDGSNKAINSTFHWVGEGGQPTWLWGSNDGTNAYVYNPSNFRVSYANSAGSASSVAWGNVSGKPSTFAPSAHSHSWDATTGKPTGIVKVASWDGSTLSLTTVT